MKRTLTLLAWLLFVPLAVNAADTQDKFPPLPGRELRNPAVIDTIVTEGNRVTKRFVILNEISLHPGMRATEDLMNQDRQRLESLQLFSRAEVNLVELPDGKTALVVRVTELWYIWPGLFIAIDQQNPKRYAYGLIVSDNNFRGRRETLSVDGRYGFITGFQLDWNIPYISSKFPDWSIKTQARAVVEEEPRYLPSRTGIEALERSLKVRFGHRFNLENSIWVDSWTVMRHFRVMKGFTGIDLNQATSGDNYNLLSEVRIGFQRDTRHYKPWPSMGYVLIASMGAATGFGNSNTRFTEPSANFAKVYSPWPRIHLLGQVNGGAILGTAPVYRWYLIDRENSVRTAMRKAFEGTWLAASTVEFRADLIPITYITIKTFSFLQRYSHDLKFGLSVALFADWGVVGGKSSPSLGYMKVRYGNGWEVAYGAGIVFHVPYQDLVRFEAVRSGRFPSDGIFYRVRVGTSF